MNKLRHTFQAQCADPRGLGGWLAGRMMLHRPADRARARWAVSLLELDARDHVLDVGFGPGYSTALIAARVTAGVVVGVDRSELMFSMAQRRLKRELAMRRVTLVCADAAELPRFDVSFDKVAAIDALDLTDPQPLLKGLHARMSPGGRIAVICQPHEREGHASAAQRMAVLLAARLEAGGFQRPYAHFHGSAGRTAVGVVARAAQESAA